MIWIAHFANTTSPYSILVSIHCGEVNILVIYLIVEEYLQYFVPNLVITKTKNYVAKHITVQKEKFLHNLQTSASRRKKVIARRNQ